jgi:hypothetical protein
MTEGALILGLFHLPIPACGSIDTSKRRIDLIDPLGNMREGRRKAKSRD